MDYSALIRDLEDRKCRIERAIILKAKGEVRKNDDATFELMKGE